MTSENSANTGISGNEAVSRAEEQAKQTAGRNIPALGDLPVAEDTANLRQGPNLHDGLLGLLPLVGAWRGEGHASPTNGDADYAFGQQIIFAHDGENYLSYSSRIWRLDEEGEAVGQDRRETGFVRISEKDDIEFLTVHSDGVVEVMYGRPRTERAWELESASTLATETGPASFGPGKRLYGLMPNNNLGWVDERMPADGGELTPWMSAELSRVIG
ncbi:MAG: FABP family protein [Mycobacteriaceae bacterium]|uniref:FABP family protein n=1 Tax=Corynebacterium sp. TaxID=1720 RepID=UPI003F9C7630